MTSAKFKRKTLFKQLQTAKIKWFFAFYLKKFEREIGVFFFSELRMKVSTKFLFIINHQLRNYIIEDTCIHTIFQLGLKSYAPFSFCFFLSSFSRKYVLYQ